MRMNTKMDGVGACTTGMLLGLVLLKCWGLYYWKVVVGACTTGNVVVACTTGMLLGLVLLKCCWGLYYWNVVVGACTTGMLLGLVLLECCWGLYYWNVVGACTTGMRKQLYHIRVWNGCDHSKIHRMTCQLRCFGRTGDRCTNNSGLVVRELILVVHQQWYICSDAMITPRPVGEPQPNNDAVNHGRRISEPAADRPRQNGGVRLTLHCWLTLRCSRHRSRPIRDAFK